MSQPHTTVPTRFSLSTEAYPFLLIADHCAAGNDVCYGTERRQRPGLKDKSYQIVDINARYHNALDTGGMLPGKFKTTRRDHYAIDR